MLDAHVVLIERPTADGESLVVEVAKGENVSELLGLRLDRQRSKSGRALTRRRSERVDSLIDDPEVDQTVPRMVGATAALFVPLVVRSKAIGVVVAFDKLGSDPRFSDSDLRVAEAFANRAALALELSERVGRESVRALLEGQELERSRLSRELHDETGQALASIMLGLKTLEPQVGEEALVQLRELVASALGNVRRLTVELRPPALDDFGLGAALERLATVLSERSALDVQLNVSCSGLPAAHETAIYRIVQEALTNIIKHAEAQTVSIVIAATDGSVRVVVEDDGIGFAVEGVRDGALGLVGMRERVALLGGRLDVQSAAGRGTTIMGELPLAGSRP
jgi:signal transduction histidine kinase